MKRTVIMALVALTLSLSPAFAKVKPVEGFVNLNTASVTELMLLPGIGKSKADAIVAFRGAHPFKAVDELQEVKGIGPKMFEKVSKYLTVTGPTTIHELSPTGRAPSAPAAKATPQ